MRCLECERPLTLPGLQVAMEQKEHFALVRHAEICAVCALRALPVFQQAGSKSLYWRQSVNCALCGNKFPIARLRFEIPHHYSGHIALCETCYRKLRDDLMIKAPNTVGFIEKEWQTPHLAKAGTRLPLANGTQVRVKRTQPRYAGQYGSITGFRGLVQPWYGYTVRLSGGISHFFHERDLEILSAVPVPQNRE